MAPIPRITTSAISATTKAESAESAFCTPGAANRRQVEGSPLPVHSPPDRGAADS